MIGDIVIMLAAGWFALAMTLFMVVALWGFSKEVC